MRHTANGYKFLLCTTKQEKIASHSTLFCTVEANISNNFISTLSAADITLNKFRVPVLFCYCIMSIEVLKCLSILYVVCLIIRIFYMFLSFGYHYKNLAFTH